LFIAVSALTLFGIEKLNLFPFFSVLPNGFIHCCLTKALHRVFASKPHPNFKRFIKQ